MVVDPWGDIIAQMSDREGFFVCELDFDYLDSVRGNMLCLKQAYLQDEIVWIIFEYCQFHFKIFIIIKKIKYLNDHQNIINYSF